ncbi:hypothetical protein PAXRUDRAFT_159776 [Paxillus rubicundulus Ve08.2h10]|uniref:Uncharacterized protein n=1 Tax=Paxillus rubicundulus Ve08.2h10 TaxID=930991 RepID=A0A0D0DNA1_9AGAM|nr:hypothetical protein PAXRUDRAFT_159776 [Paxillus rubicundulus Ve08.2h10]
MQLCQHWEVSELSDTHFCIGITIECDCPSCTVKLSQVALIDYLLTQYHMIDAHPVSTPMDPGLHLTELTDDEHNYIAQSSYKNLVDSLNYVAQGMCPDTAFVVHQLCCFLDHFNKVHWEAAKLSHPVTFPYHLT